MDMNMPLKRLLWFSCGLGTAVGFCYYLWNLCLSEGSWEVAPRALNLFFPSYLRTRQKVGLFRGKRLAATFATLTPDHTPVSHCHSELPCGWLFEVDPVSPIIHTSEEDWGPLQSTVLMFVV